MKVSGLNCTALLVAFNLLLSLVYNTYALPATTSAPTTHIVSYVRQRKAKAKYDEFPDFDFESIRGANKPSKTHSNIVQLMEAANATALDDLQTAQKNTLENEILDPAHHESPGTVGSNGTIQEWQRSKQNIPVLETVRHLVHSVRDGHLNHTSHVRDQHHLLSGSEKGGEEGNETEEMESSAIETEEDRESANESTGFQVLDLFGMLGSMIWTFIMNFQRLFAAGSSNASGSSSFGR